MRAFKLTSSLYLQTVKIQRPKGGGLVLFSVVADDVCRQSSSPATQLVSSSRSCSFDLSLDPDISVSRDQMLIQDPLIADGIYSIV